MTRWSEDDFTRWRGGSAGKKPRATPIQHEDNEQINLVAWMRDWARWRGRPLTEIYAHVPNQRGTRTAAENARLKRMGVRAGYPDMIGDVAAGGYHSHRIELKRVGGDKPQPHQLAEHEKLRWLGHRVDVCFGAEEAKKAIEHYLGLSGHPIVITAMTGEPAWGEKR